jgi:hypothetical protein
MRENPVLTIKIWYDPGDESIATLEGQTGHAPWASAIAEEIRDRLRAEGKSAGRVVITDAKEKVVDELEL